MDYGDHALRPEPAERNWSVARMDFRERLRQVALNEVRFAESPLDQERRKPVALDSKSLALVRLAALVAVGGAVPSFGAEVDAAVSAGASPMEIVDVLVGVIPAVGLPCVVEAAPRLALALGYDIESDF